jgi:hypothetical protein
MKRVVLAAGMAAAVAAVATLVGITPAMALPPPATCTEAAAEGLLPIPSNARHVTLCHFTGSDSNPFVINQPSLSAAETHAGHHDDCVRYFDGTVQCGL